MPVVHRSETLARVTPPAAEGALDRRAWLAGASAVLAVGLVIAAPRFLLGPIYGDEGFLAHGAERVLRGELPNRDFVSLQPPLSFYLVAAVFGVFEPSLAALRGLGLALHEAVLLATYAFATRLARPLFAAIAVAPLAVTGLAIQRFVPYAVWLGALWSMLAAALLLLAASRGSRAWAAAAGATSALALASRHDQGVYLCLASGLLLLLLGRAERGAESSRSGAPATRLALAWLLGVAAVSLPLLAGWLVAGALPAMIEQLVLFPITTYGETSGISWPSFGPDGRLLPTLLYYLPGAAVIGAAAGTAWRGARRGLDRRGAALAFVTLLAALFYLQVFTRSDLFHLVVTLPPAFVLLAAGLDALASALAPRTPRPGATTWVLAALAALALGMGTRALSPWMLPGRAADVRRLELPRGGVLLTEYDAQRYERAVRFLETRVPAEDSILALPYEPIYWFLSGRRNPTPWLYLWPGDQTPADHEELVRRARADPPGAVILHRPERLRASAPGIVDWVESRFEPIARVRGTVFYVPRALDEPQALHAPQALDGPQALDEPQALDAAQAPGAPP